MPKHWCTSCGNRCKKSEDLLRKLLMKTRVTINPDGSGTFLAVVPWRGAGSPRTGLEILRALLLKNPGRGRKEGS